MTEKEKIDKLEWQIMDLEDEAKQRESHIQELQSKLWGAEEDVLEAKAAKHGLILGVICLFVFLAYCYIRNN